jgi:CTP:molybdopterin cytidylyltransferase MocA
VIAVAAVIVTYAWVMTFTSTQTQQAGVILVEENIAWPSSTTIQVTIRNTGTSNAKIVSAYQGTDSNNLAVVSDVNPSLPQNVNAGQSTTLTLTLSSAWSTNTMYYFKFATDTPAVLQFGQKSPSA